MKVKFINVGRSKATWEAECKELNYEWLYGQVRPYLASRDLEFDLMKDNFGVIYAGFRNVGKFEIEEKTKEIDND